VKLTERLTALALGVVCLLFMGCEHSSRWEIKGDYDTYPGVSLRGYPIRLEVMSGDRYVEDYAAELSADGSFRISVDKVEDAIISVTAGLSASAFTRGELVSYSILSNEDVRYDVSASIDEFVIPNGYIFNPIELTYTGPGEIENLSEISYSWDDSIPGDLRYSLGLVSMSLSGVAIIHNIEDSNFSGDLLGEVEIVSPPLSFSQIRSLSLYAFRAPEVAAGGYHARVTAYLLDEEDGLVKVGASLPRTEVDFIVRSTTTVKPE
jgi:hypothetical protein